MKNFKCTLAGLLLCLPLSAWADLIVNRDIVDFGNVPLGGFAFEVVIVTNDGNTVITDVTVALSGKSQAISVNNCATVLFPGQSCSLTVEYVPDNYGTKKKRLNIDGIITDTVGTIHELSHVVEITGRSDNPNK